MGGNEISPTISMDWVPTRRMSAQRRILIVLFIASFALDFKGDPGGSPIQVLMAVLNSVTFLLLVASQRARVPARGVAAFIFWGWAFFLTVGTVAAFINNTPFDRYIRVVYNFVLFLEGYLVAYWAARDARNAMLVVSAMSATGVVSMMFTCLWGFHHTSLGFQEIRYQILTPLIPFLLVVGGYDLILARRHMIWSSLLLLVTLALIGISVTRGPFLIMGFVIIVFLVAASLNALHTMRFPKPLLQVPIFGIISGSLAITAIAFLNANTLERWVDRSLGVARNVSLWTPVAAALAAFDILSTTPFAWLTGLGFGSSYPWFFSKFPWILPYLGKNLEYGSAWFPGEFMWMSILFYGGFIAGSIGVMVLLWSAFRSFHLLRALLLTRSWRYPKLRPFWIGGLGYLAFVGMGFTANPFIFRLASMFMGLCSGLVVAHRHLFQPGGMLALPLRVRGPTQAWGPKGTGEP